MLEMRRLERTSRCGHQGAQESNKDTASVTCPHKANDEETGGNGMMGTQQFREGWHPTWEAETGQQENKLRHPNRKGNRSFPNSQEWMNTAGGFLFTSFRFFAFIFTTSGVSYHLSAKTAQAEDNTNGQQLSTKIFK